MSVCKVSKEKTQHAKVCQSGIYDKGMLCQCVMYQVKMCYVSMSGMRVKAAVTWARAASLYRRKLAPPDLGAAPWLSLTLCTVPRFARTTYRWNVLCTTTSTLNATATTTMLTELQIFTGHHHIHYKSLLKPDSSEMTSVSAALVSCRLLINQWWREYTQTKKKKKGIKTANKSKRLRKTSAVCTLFHDQN